MFWAFLEGAYQAIDALTYCEDVWGAGRCVGGVWIWP